MGDLSQRLEALLSARSRACASVNMQTREFLCGLPLAFQVLSNAFRAERVVDVRIDGVMMIVLIPVMVIMVHIEPAHACTKVVAKFARRDI